MRRDLAVAAAALLLGAVGLVVGAIVVWTYVVSALRGPYPVDWLTADLSDGGRTLTVTYEEPCGSSYSHTDTELDSADRLVVTVHVEGRAIYCSEDYRTNEVIVPLDDPLDPTTAIVDGSLD